MTNIFPYWLRLTWLLWLLTLLFVSPAAAQTTVKKVVLQAYWWDYWNNNYPNGWTNYLVDLAPRLKAMGIDAVWLPPTVKNKNATSDVGYSPFDHYDLGDKYQKGNTTTRLGTKDELLRLVAVLHANGIEVIQDVVLNHADGAGTANGAGGQDPDAYSMRTNSGYKNFRYSSFATPAPETGETGTEYLMRRGRWPKNYHNFHPHLGHDATSGDMAAPWFGPDFCFGNDGGNDGYGGLSALVLSQYPTAYNPTQAQGYSQNQARAWVQWMKKQTDVDGFRWDAVKHFSYNAQQDLSYNLKYLNGWASGGEEMFNVGEYVGSKTELDGYVANVQSQNGGQDFLMGTFDFGLRDGLYQMVSQGGNFNIGTLPNYQQNQRVAYYSGTNTRVHRTVPFVNNHDTFRPQLNGSGNYIGWNTGSELAPHIDPFDVRMPGAYAVALAVDGSPQIFFEDLFNVGGSGRRYTHLPTSPTDLPARADLVNLIWCHQNLRFKDGDYLVRWQAADHLVIERSAQALVSVNDSYSTWQTNAVETSFAVGTVLHDYSGATTTTRTVYLGTDGKRYVSISTPPCNPALNPAGRHGYAVWAPAGQGTTYAPPRSPVTTQEWELADDLGDLNCQSLGQGGRLPDNSTNSRLVGKIFVQAGQPVTYRLTPELGNRSLTVGVYDLRGNALSTASGTGTVEGTYTPAFTGWLALKARNTTATYTGQRAFVRVSYTAPTAPDTRSTAAPRNEVAIWTGNNNSGDMADCRNWENGVEPSAATDVLIPAGSTFMPQLSAGTLVARQLTVEPAAILTLAAGTTLRLTGNLVNNGTLAGPGTVEFNGRTTQTSSGTTTFGGLTVNNAAGLSLLGAATVTEALHFAAGRLTLDGQDLTLTATATLSGTGPTQYIVTDNTPTATGTVRRTVPGNARGVEFPVGTAASYTPLYLANLSPTTTEVQVRVFAGLLENGTAGPAYSRQGQFVNRTWYVSPSISPAQLVATAQWNASDESPNFQRGQAAPYVNADTGSSTWQAIGSGVVAGTGPYTMQLPEIAGFSLLSVGTAAAPLPVTLTRFTARHTAPTTALLEWTTAWEQHNAGFEVEKSMDGRAFRVVGQVPGQGSSTQLTRYAFPDPDAADAAYYRLRQHDVDGTQQHSPVVYLAAEAGTGQFVLLPNPTAGRVTLRGSAVAGPVFLTLTTLHGQLLLPCTPGTLASLTEKLNAALLTQPAGVLIVTLETTNHRQHLRLVKE